MKPTKEKFKEYMNYIIRKNEAETKIDSIISTYNDVYQDGIWPIDTGTGMMVEMLETMLDLPIDDLLRSTCPGGFMIWTLVKSSKPGNLRS